jgi:hypothetical protein
MVALPCDPSPRVRVSQRYSSSGSAGADSSGLRASPDGQAPSASGEWEKSA